MFKKKKKKEQITLDSNSMHSNSIIKKTLAILSRIYSRNISISFHPLSKPPHHLISIADKETKPFFPVSLLSWSSPSPPQERNPSLLLSRNRNKIDTGINSLKGDASHNSSYTVRRAGRKKIKSIYILYPAALVPKRMTFLPCASEEWTAICVRCAVYLAPNLQRFLFFETVLGSFDDVATF